LLDRDHLTRPRAHVPLLRDARAAARVAGLAYVRAGERGIARRRSGRGFVYVRPGGERVKDRKTLDRIRALAIPPAWTDVWICDSPRGHLQATGRDARGRKQYRYHAEWRALRDEAKYHGVVPFGHALPKVRASVKRDLRRPRLDRKKVAAIAVRLLDETGIRVGNDAYARDNRSFGLTTLRDHHARISPARLELDFVGKGGRRRRISIQDRRLAELVRRCRDVPGQRLFQYYDDAGRRRSLGSADVNRYLAEAGRQPFTAKEFRTFHACVCATLLLAAKAPPRSKSQRNRAVNEALRRVAEGLGNTLAIARKCYVHPAIIDAYASGELGHDFRAELARTSEGRNLRRDERAVLAFLASRAKRARPAVTTSANGRASRARRRSRS
jgi:DNA topoisomerase-1